MADLTDYYYERAGQPAGPLPAGELRAQGVRAVTLVWQTGMDAWVPAGSVPGLQELFAPQPPPLPNSVAGEAGLSVAPALSGVPVQPTVVPVPPPAPPPAHPQFSTEGRRSTHPWWHFLLLAVVVLGCLLLARACGAILVQVLSMTSSPVPPLAGAPAWLPNSLVAEGWAT